MGSARTDHSPSGELPSPRSQPIPEKCGPERPEAGLRPTLESCARGDDSQNGRPQFFASAKASMRDWMGLMVLTLPCLLYSMDMTVLDVVIPALSAALKPSASQLLWILDIYSFILAAMLIPMGAVGDRIGRRRLLLFGACAFAIASTAAAFSRSPEMLIAMRALLGLAGATLAPTTLALLRQMFRDSAERTTAVTVWVASFTAGGALGPVIAGSLLHNFWWGSVFLVGVPLMILLLIFGPILLPEYRNRRAEPVDFTSAILSLMAVLATIYGLKQIATHVVGGIPILSIIFGFALGVLFIRRQARLDRPMIDLRVIRAPASGTALWTYALACFVIFGSMVFVAQYMQLVQGLTPMLAGLWSVPFAASSLLGSSLTTVLVRRLGTAAVICGGLVVGALGFVSLSTVGENTTPLVLTVMCCIYSTGLTPVLTLTTDMIVSSVPVDRAGTASVTAETASELGGALGIALLGSVGAALYRHEMANGALGSRISVTDTLGAAVSSAQGLDNSIASAVIHQYRAAFVESFRAVSLMSALILTLAAIAVWWNLRAREPAEK